MKHVKFFVFLCFLTFAVSCSQQKKYIDYKVKEGETMRTIASDLDMKTSDLLRLNPNFGRKPKVNSVIVIPSKKVKSKDGAVEDDVLKQEGNTEEENGKAVTEESEEELNKNFVTYEVKKGDTFYSLTRFYNVSQEKMIALNPVLSEGLKVGQIIKLREIEEGVTVIENHIYEDVVEEYISLKVALLLPFKTNENDSIKAKKLFTKSKLVNIVTDFYLGAEIAVDSLRKQGIDIDLNVYDTETKNTKIRSIISEKNLNSNDVIIGPLYSEEAEIVANSVNTPVIYPFYSKNQYKFSSSELIKSSPEKKVFREELTTYVKDNFSKGSIIIVGDGKSASNSSNAIIKQSLEASDSISIVHVLKPQKGYIAKNRFLKILKPYQDNWVVLTSDNAVLIENAVNSLISLPDSTHIRVFAINKGKAFDKIANSKLAKINLTYVSDEYVDELSASTQLFNKQYYKKNKALPSFHATKGFDITYDVLMRLASGDKLKKTFKEGASYRIESKFDYSNETSSTYENKGLFIVQYNKDLSLTRLK